MAQPVPVPAAAAASRRRPLTPFVPDDATLYVGGVSPNADESALREWFASRYGEVRRVEVKNSDRRRTNERQRTEDDTPGVSNEAETMIDRGRRRINKQKKPFAFVVFAEAASVDKALRDAAAADAQTNDDKAADAASSSPAELSTTNPRPPFDGVVARPQNSGPLPPKAAERRRKREAARIEEEDRLRELGRRFRDAKNNTPNSVEGETVLALRCPASHAARFGRYLLEGRRGEQLLARSPRGEAGEMTVAAFRRPGNVTLLFFSVSSSNTAREVHDALRDDPNLGTALDKLYVLGRGARLVRSGDGADKAGLEAAGADRVKLITEAITDMVRDIHRGKDHERLILRVDTFPLKLADLLQSRLEQSLPAEIDFSPTGFTHSISVLEVSEGSAYAVGLSRRKEFTPSFRPTAHNRGGGAPTGDTAAHSSSGAAATCRAHHKLLEAVRRYFDLGAVVPPDHFQGKVAVDCGAAPGGWTQCLLQHGASAVYAIDPAQLDPAVAKMEGAHHMKERADVALPKLVEEGVKATIWVSDMCLHDVEDQVSYLLRAREMGVVGAGTLFVLTLKCNRGHSDAAYDARAEEIVRTMLLGGGGGSGADGEKEGGVSGTEKRPVVARDVRIVHLFANRGGERTVIGYLA